MLQLNMYMNFSRIMSSAKIVVPQAQKKSGRSDALWRHDTIVFTDVEREDQQRRELCKKLLCRGVLQWYVAI